jgi:hypothetical protein
MTTEQPQLVKKEKNVIFSWPSFLLQATQETLGPTNPAKIDPPLSLFSPK